MDKGKVLKGSKVSLLIVVLLYCQINVGSSAITDKFVIKDSFLIESNGYTTLNFTNIECNYFFIIQNVSASIQTFIVNESQFIRFKNRETFTEVFGDYFTVYFQDNIPQRTSFGNLSISTIVCQIGKIIVLLNNINDFKVSGSFLMKKISLDTETTTTTAEIVTVIQNITVTHYITIIETTVIIQNKTVTQIVISTIKVSVPLQPIEKTSDSTNGFTLLVIGIVFSVIVVIKKQRK